MYLVLRLTVRTQPEVPLLLDEFHSGPLTLVHLFFFMSSLQHFVCLQKTTPSATASAIPLTSPRKRPGSAGIELNVNGIESNFNKRRSTKENDTTYFTGEAATILSRTTTTNNKQQQQLLLQLLQQLQQLQLQQLEQQQQ